MTPLSLGIFASANQSAAATSFESIATVTVGSGGAANVEFTSIPSTYTHLQIRAISRTTDTGTAGDVGIRINADTASNYTTHQIFGDGSSVTANVAGSSTSTTLGYPFYGTGNGALSNNFGVMVLDILDYANTNKYKTWRSLNGYDNNGSGYAIFRSGHWRSTSAITSLKFYDTSSNNFVQYSHFALYGIKVAA